MNSFLHREVGVAVGVCDFFTHGRWGQSVDIDFLTQPFSVSVGGHRLFYTTVFGGHCRSL